MHNSLNESACAALRESVQWSDPSLLASLTVLAIINVLVIVGNCLVIAAVFCSSKLRSVTNLFIVSLAVADLLVGIAVLPFSATWEVFKVWIFGDVWCSVWLAVDVWMCTASILNLCAISLDRYVAVARPVRYPSLMSRKRAKALIAGLWVLSFVICFPPLVGWKDREASEAVIYKNKNHTLLSQVPNPPCPWTCELTNDAGYVVYSALGSFYIPMFVMLFFYWRIYKAAVRTTKAINQGFRTTKSKGVGNRFDDNRLTLRIHRGRGGGGTTRRGPQGSPLSTGSAQSTTTSLGSASPERIHRCSNQRRSHEKIKISVSYPSTEQICPAGSPPSSPPALYAVHYCSPGGQELTSSTLYRNRDNHLRVTGQRMSGSRHSRRSSSCDSSSVAAERDMSPSPSSAIYEESNKPKAQRKMGKRNIKAQVKKFRMETKAAKTLGIIVGGFIFCWLPFFTMYLIRAFCEKCIHPLVFSILFWLGYCNSAINPLIYALFSKDFRFAFKRIICRCLCNRVKSTDKSRRGSDGSQMKACKSPSYNRQPQHNSLGEDSDPAVEGSDSR
ncbi:octopamine receptor in mushroom bodies [Arctopsyche grandis]|uniref:octopamine receptor in mushroom bodies n=1 Tax=Arctopsyche grandis TaxID=121162 RepID=UPI00406D92A1